MRRSNAPSKIGSKFIPPSLCVGTSAYDQSSDVLTPIENANRSTQSILGLIAKVKQPAEIMQVQSENYHRYSDDLSLKQPITDPTENVENLQTCPAPKNNIRVFNVVFGKPSKKKHKTWEGDGVLEVGEKSLILKDCDGNILGRGSGKKNSELEEGSRLFVASKEVEIIDAVSSTSAEKVNRKRPPETEGDKSPPSRHKRANVQTSITSVLQPYTPLVMPQPDLDHQWQFNKNGAAVNTVIVDPCLTRVLRPHQREGVVFLYSCVTGLRDPGYLGAILADEMGLGKTLQCITLIWTLLRQGMYGRIPEVRKVLIVTPSSLTANWQQEFLRWLGRDRIYVFTVDQKNKPKDFLKLPNIPVMITSYEMFVRCYDDVASVTFDLVICDEGHRLKNNSIRAATLLSQLPCMRRVLLSGTPIQNDLQEFFALVNFVNPNILGTYSEFRQQFEESIVAWRQPGAESDGEEVAQELTRITAGFILRRTHELLTKHLPGKHEVVLFCRPSTLQLELFAAVIDRWQDDSHRVSHLAVITALKKISNHPALFIQPNTDNENVGSFSEQIRQKLSDISQDRVLMEDASKLCVVAALLHSTAKTSEKIVLVSYFTQTLDLLAALCDQFGYQHCRLDGQTPAARRLDIVNQFNCSYSTSRVFLLSARAGGVGLNLTGASRLVMFDSDWNPASDLQAMARVWRDGQTTPVHIYRLLTTGSIEEKIFQRQLSKAGLNEAVVDPSHPSAVRLSDEELKDLFSLDEGKECLTHEMLCCDCQGLGDVPQPLVPQADTRQCQLLADHSPAQAHTLRINQLFQWQHYKQPLPLYLLQEMGLEEAGHLITFMFRNVMETTSPS